MVIILKFRWLWNYCDLIVFIFICMIITRVEFDNKYFETLIVNLNKFCENFVTWYFVTWTN